MSWITLNSGVHTFGKVCHDSFGVLKFDLIQIALNLRKENMIENGGMILLLTGGHGRFDFGKDASGQATLLSVQTVVDDPALSIPDYALVDRKVIKRIGIEYPFDTVRLVLYDMNKLNTMEKPDGSFYDRKEKGQLLCNYVQFLDPDYIIPG